MLSSRFGTPYLRLTEGAPIGYPAVRSFVREVAEAMEVDPQPALDIIDREAGSVHRVLMNFDRQCTSLYAKGMVLKGDSSVVYPIMKWMMGTFGMVPRSVTLMDDAYLPEIRQCLSEHGLEDALNGLDGDVEVVFSDGLESLEGRLSVTTSSYVEIGLPRGRMMDLMGRTLIGPKGCRYILDEMMNGRIRFRCGQPTEVDYRPGGQEE
jgi:hypothetical protein